MIGVYENETGLYLTYDWLIAHGIKYKTIENWIRRDRGVCKPLIHEGRSYIKYSEIPAPSRKKLPSEETIIQNTRKASMQSYHNYMVDQCYRELCYAFEYDWIPFRSVYEKLGFNTEKSTTYAKDHALWKRIIELRDGNGKDERAYRPGVIYDAYKRICPNGYVYDCMSMAYKTIREKGIPSLLVKFVSRKGNTYARKFNDWHKAFIIKWASSGKAYDAVKIHNELAAECRAAGKPIPSYTWCKYRIAEYKEAIGSGRYGQNAWDAKNAPYAGVIKALNPNTQWAADGWKLPFYLHGFERLTLFAVMDSHSGYIIDYDVAKTENTENILCALNRAVETAGCLPHELVTDRHSFTKTEEASYFKANLERLGTTWTIDSNPRRKGIIERNLGVFGNRFMKDFPGYIGQGIKSKDINGHTSQEELDKYTRSGMWRTAEEVKIYVHLCVEAYNNYIAEKDKDNPNVKSHTQLYDNPDQPYKIPVGLEDRLRLFIRESIYKVQRGQINIKRDLELHEFQLNAELIAKYNNKNIKVRYESLDEIYLFDLDTDECLGSIKPKRKMHGALADQDETDKQGYYL